MKLSTFVRQVLSLALLSALVSCGGGGGGGNSSAPSQGPFASTTYALSGTILLPGTAAVDSDTNDPDQAGWASNDTDVTAQILASPVQLVGTLNIANKGPTGKTYAAGDVKDIFKVSLVAGQVIELAFAGSTADNDVDLMLFDVASTTSAVAVGVSNSPNSNHECIVVSRSGDYYVIPWISKGAAAYSLNISALGDASSCSNAASGSVLFATDALIAKEKPSLETQFGSNYAALSAASTGNFPKLIAVPYTRNLRTYAAEIGTPAGRDDDIDTALATLRYAKNLMGTGRYAYVEPNLYLHSMSYAPDDQRYSDQKWHMEMIKQPSAMDRITDLALLKAKRPVVAVVDEGFVANHPDMAGQFVDSRTFIGGASFPGADGPQSGCQNPTSDSFCFHGFFIAGIVAALSNNGIFGASVAPYAQVMPIQTSLSTYDVIQGMLYASGLPNASGTVPSRKADVINMSFGGAGLCSSAFADVIAQARSNNVVVVGASGNTDGTGPHPVAQPANCAGVISVGALDSNRARASYSGYGPELSLVAPGGGSGGRADAVWSLAARWLNNTWTPAFAGGTGTSFSAPHVAGVLALMRYVDPDITVEQIDTLLASGRLTDDVGPPGRDDQYGQGVINARKAVDEAISLAAGASLPGVVVALPPSIGFGNVLSSATLRIGVTAITPETVLTITASHSAVTVKPSSVGTTGLGDYTVSVDRNLLPVGFSYPTLKITTSSRSFIVPLSLVKLSVAANSTASLGSMWVQATNLDTGAVIKRKLNVSAGKYAWSLTGLSAGRTKLIASTDLNNDGVLCDDGEACGNYPGNAQLLQVGSDLSGLDFAASPILNPAGSP